VTEDLKSNNMSDMTDDDKLWAFLSYAFFLIGVIALFMEDKKTRPVIRYAAFHSIVLGVAGSILGTVLGLIPFVNCIAWLVSVGIWGYSIYLGYMIYSKGEVLAVPVVTDFIKGQGWI
jgi:uncharacterized membrane protein